MRGSSAGGGELPPLHIESQGNTAVDPTPASLSNLLPRMPSGYLQRTLSSFKYAWPPCGCSSTAAAVPCRLSIWWQVLH